VGLRASLRGGFPPQALYTEKGKTGKTEKAEKLEKREKVSPNPACGKLDYPSQEPWGVRGPLA
jgi:hypothetical protein